MGERIVIIEDDESIRRLLEVAFQSHSYEPAGFARAEQALQYMNSETPAVAVIDIMMEGIGGIEAVRRMRRSEQLRGVPVILLTAKDTETDKIIGLDAGADDYVTKPFSVLELCARVRAQLRRVENVKKNEEQPAVYESGELMFNAAAREVVVSGNPVELTFKEFELLKILIENRGRALARPELLQRVWGEDYCGETRTLDIHIGTLRQKLGDAAESSRYIKTVRGVGYKFIGGDDT